MCTWHNGYCNKETDLMSGGKILEDTECLTSCYCPWERHEPSFHLKDTGTIVKQAVLSNLSRATSLREGKTLGSKSENC